MLAGIHRQLLPPVSSLSVPRSSDPPSFDLNLKGSITHLDSIESSGGVLQPSTSIPVYVCPPAPLIIPCKSRQIKVFLQKVVLMPSFIYTSMSKRFCKAALPPNPTPLLPFLFPTGKQVSEFQLVSHPGFMTDLTVTFQEATIIGN